jgi:hypothetical protein
MEWFPGSVFNLLFLPPKFVAQTKSVPQMVFVGHGFSRDIELPENLGFSP